MLFFFCKKGTPTQQKQPSLNKMSRNNMTRNTNSVRKPFCAHCQNTGEPENVYSSHYPRSLPDRLGKTTVTCPKLRATECAFCYEFGHTRKFCPVLKANQRTREIEERKMQTQQQQQQTSTKKQSQQKNLGAYAALVEDDSDEEHEVETVKEEWPALSGATASGATASVARTASVAPSGYAAMAAKPVRVYEPEPQTPVSAYQVINKGDRMTKTEVEPEPYVPTRNTASWLDLTDDEEEQEQEQEEDDDFW